MLKTKKTFLLLLLTATFIVTLISCTTSYSLITSEKTTNEVFIDRGNEYQIVSSTDIQIVASGLDVDDGDNRIILGIQNGSDINYNFQDSQIKIFGGNASSNNWTEIKTWNAQEFYLKTKTEYDTAIRMNAIAGVLNVMSASLGTVSNTTVYTRYGNAKITTRTYNPTDVSIAAMTASITDNNLRNAKKTDLGYLKDNLLYSTQISPTENYSGLIFFDSDRKYPDYKIVFSDTNKDAEFLFTRTDREEIIHPWTTDSSRVLNALTFTKSINHDRWGINYYWLEPKGIGMYTGFSLMDLSIEKQLQNSNKLKGYYYSYEDSGKDGNYSYPNDPDPNDGISSYDYQYRFTESQKYFSAFGMPIGITYKLAKQTWLLAGMNFALSIDSYSKGNLEYRVKTLNHQTWEYTYGEYKYLTEGYTYSSKMTGAVEAQIGANFVFNFIDLNAIASYDFINKRFIFEASTGIAL